MMIVQLRKIFINIDRIQNPWLINSNFNNIIIIHVASRTGRIKIVAKNSIHQIIMQLEYIVNNQKDRYIRKLETKISYKM